MVEKMKYISITGHITAMNHVVNRYFSRYDIQLEKVAEHPDMEPFTTLNPYAQTLQKAERFKEMFGDKSVLHIPVSAADAVNRVEEAHRAYEARDEAIREKERQKNEIEAYLQGIAPFLSLEADVSELGGCRYLHFRAGRMASAHYKQYETFLRADEKIIFITTKRDAAYVWGIYFTPTVHAQEADAVFTSLQFEVIPLTAECMGERKNGTVAELDRVWQKRLIRLRVEIRTLAETLLPEGSVGRLRIACDKVRTLYDAFDVKKFAALSKGRRVFTFVGWMGASDADALENEIGNDPLVILTRPVSEEETAPTRLRNPPLVRQFEFFTRLYGLPSYGETDPTFVLAVTYTLLFGLMFGDVGHGLCLALVGAVIGARYKKPLGWIITVVGASAMGFGFLYGSVFGFEDLLPALWRRPSADIMGTLLFAVGLGAGLIVLSMVLYMYNALRQGRMGDFLFTANGASGLVFYAALVYGAVRVFYMGRNFPIWLLVIPLVLLALKHPFTRLLEGRRGLLEGGVGAFLFQTIMELFETLLTYATNTVSFVRVGAFAVSHAGMMHVVLQLSQGVNVSGRVLILVLGNVLVMGIEGLLVGIQVLRLDFYELFSRFYKGGGRVFISHKINRI
ncbi:MAG: ATPase [Defluviitaleaceae bacterium]|nr:ATPase [Defluviitaleaceae bacterium]